ncbi:MAG: hypothetical protein KAT76_04225 [Bacteroidales bacterium]|nr:hypothetical protein [Bacteroidales bacterium]
MAMPFNTSSVIRGYVKADGENGIYIFEIE